MSGISDALSSVQNGEQGVKETQNTQKKSYVAGKTIGTPKLSEKGAKYYEELKKKYSNMDFILVSKDQKENAKAQAGNYANPNRMVVLIDEEKIERMAEDENYRKQYEAIISNGANSLSQMAQKLKSSGVSVKAFGMQVKDNRASFFAAVDKSFATQRKNQQKRIAEKKEAKKAEAKKAQRKEAEERRAEKTGDKEAAGTNMSEETEILSASSVEELIQKIQDYEFAAYSDRVQTAEEKQLGQHIDFSA